MKTFFLSIVLLTFSGIPVLSQTIIFEEEFDRYGNWYSENGVWEIGELDDGTTVAATVLKGDYPNETDSRLISPSILLPPLTDDNHQLLLQIWHWHWYLHNINANDHGQIQISIRENSGWGDWINVGPFFNRDSIVRYQTIVDLSLYSGNQIRIAFFHYDEGNTQAKGWYIDSLFIKKASYFFDGYEDFELGYDNWSISNGIWQIGRPTSGPKSAFQGDNVAATVLEGNYSQFVESRLMSAPIVLPVTKNIYDEVTLRFVHWYSYYSNKDFGQVQIRIFNTTGWENWIGISPKYIGSSGIWSPTHIDLTSYAGKKVQLSFYHSDYLSAGSNVASGWYVDDVKIIPSPIQTTAIIPYRLQYTFSASTSEENNFMLSSPPGFELGEVNFGLINMTPNELDYTDGVGIVVNLAQNQGATFYGKPFEVENDDYVFVRISTRTTSANVSLGIGLLDAQMANTFAESAVDGSLGLNLDMNAQPYMDRFCYLWACYEPKRDAVVPVFQAANSGEMVTVQFDNLEVIRTSKYLLPSVIRNLLNVTSENNVGKIDFRLKTIDRFFKIGDRVLIK